MTKPELVALVRELARLNKDNRAYLEAKFAEPSEIPKAAEYYKQIIKNEFFPTKGFGKLRLRKVKRAISDFKKATGDAQAVLDLMVYYVEYGTRFTSEYGDIDERFYSSMESMFKDVIDTLNKMGDRELTDSFRPRLEGIVVDAEGTGWGYYDNLSYMLDELEGEG
jgi:midasin (ATPase involved in ribosome maturation)